MNCLIIAPNCTKNLNLLDQADALDNVARYLGSARCTGRGSLVKLEAIKKDRNRQ